MSNHISSSEGPLPAGQMNMKKHDKIIIKEKCYGREDNTRNSAGIAGCKAIY